MVDLHVLRRRDYHRGTNGWLRTSEIPFVARRKLASGAFLFSQGVLMLIDYCFTSSSRDEITGIPDDSRDVDDLVGEIASVVLRFVIAAS